MNYSKVSYIENMGTEYPIFLLPNNFTTFTVIHPVIIYSYCMYMLEILYNDILRA